MDVPWGGTRVRPQAVVDLLGLDKATGNIRGQLQKRSQFRGLIRRQLGNCRHVTNGLHNQRADTQRTNAVLDGANAPCGGSILRAVENA